MLGMDDSHDSPLTGFENGRVDVEGCVRLSAIKAFLMISRPGRISCTWTLVWVPSLEVCPHFSADVGIDAIAADGESIVAEFKSRPIPSADN